MGRLAQVADACRGAGLDVGVVSAGATGTFEVTGAAPGVTEVQAGSYVLMDHFHAPLVDGFGFALTVMATVVSGATATCSSSTPAARRWRRASARSEPPDPRATLAFIHEEHAGFRYDGEAPGAVGDRVHIVPGYAPTTVNLFGAYHVVEDGRVVDVWPVLARHGDPLRAGPLGAELRGADLADVRWGGLEIASAVQVTVRDERWGTIRPTLRRADVREDAGGFSVEIEAAHGDAFVWRGTVSGSADGILDVAIEGTAERDFVYRADRDPRPPSVGAVLRRRVVRGRRRRGADRGDVPAGDRRRSRSSTASIGRWSRRSRASRSPSTAGGVRTSRSRARPTAGSWRTSGTGPTRRSRRIRRRWNARRRARCAVGSACASACTSGSRVRRPLSSPTTVPSCCAWASPAGARRRRWASPPPRTPPWTRATSPRSRRRTCARLPTCPAISTDFAPPRRSRPRRASRWKSCCSSTTTRMARASTRWCARSGTPAIARVLLLRRSGATAGGAFVSRLRPHLGPLASAPVGGGTASHFSELNRAEPDPSGLDALALAVSPEVHDADECSIMRTLEIQAQVGARVRTLADGADVVVSPLTLAAHDPAAPDDEIDARVGSDFAAAWTVGSADALSSAGVRSVTLHERADRTVLVSEGLARAFRLLSARAGRELDAIDASDVRRVCAIAAVGMPLLLANLTPRTQEVRLEGMASGGRVLGPYEVAEVARSPR